MYCTMATWGSCDGVSRSYGIVWGLEREEPRSVGGIQPEAEGGEGSHNETSGEGGGQSSSDDSRPLFSFGSLPFLFLFLCV